MKLVVYRSTNGWGDVYLPEYKTLGAAGMDIAANLGAEGVTLLPMERQLIPTGLRMEIPEGYEGQLRPRSGLALNYGVTMVNSPGTIDSDYRGEIGVILINLSDQDVKIIHGQRIAQLIIAPVVRCEIVESDRLAPSQRGNSGFGSTGG